MAIIGAHALIYTPEAEALREVLRGAFGLEHVDAGDGWLIFRLPPAEVGVHPSTAGEPDATAHALSFLCDDVDTTIAELAARGVECTGPAEDHGYGLVTYLKLPGGVRIQLYEPRHPIAADIARP